MTWATYLENNTANSRYTTRYVYDSMGNITTLWRYGLRDNNTYGLIDNLSYTYNGNQLVTVTDGRSGPDYSGAFHFSDGADEDVEYEYDQNGNLTKDLNKKITQIKYNLLNLPSNIAFMINYANYYISHTYSADGRLLHTGYLIGKDMGPVPDTPYPVFPHGGDELQAHIIDVPITPPIEPSLIDNSYSYCDNIIYHQGAVSQILFDGGYVTLSGSTPTYHYYLQDHLGNNRVVVKQDGTIEQVSHYYPFGGLFGESTNGDVQRFKYNGKELERMHGLDWYDYGARHLDAALGRWSTIDPMAEKYYNLSPYNYCGNNPVKFIDSDGREVINKFDQNKTCEKTATDIYVNNVNDLNNSIIVFAHGVGNGSGIALCDNDKIGTPFTFEMFLENNSETWNNRFVSGDNLKIVLFSCGTGIEGKFAQMISMDEAFKNISIIAPSDDITIYKNGTSSIDNGKPWVEYTNGELTNEYNGNLLPGTEEFEVSTYWEKTDINRYYWK